MPNPGESSAEILRATPGMRRLPNPRLDLFTLPHFLPAELCGELMRLIDINRRPSTIADANSDVYFRTSETCDLAPGEPAVQELERRLFEVGRIDPAHGEPIQGQRYEIGQEFKAHTDFFQPEGRDYQRFCSISGQRTWTFMVYLNDVEAGGATRFKVVGKTFQPEQGRLLCWNNRRSDGSGNTATLHHAMKVRKGLKYVITKWYREKPWDWANGG
jgi:prolyl 4-hydroxylase